MSSQAHSAVPAGLSPAALKAFCVDAAIASGRPVVVLVSSAELTTSRASERRRYAQELDDGGAEVVEWTWSDQGRGAVLTALGAIFERTSVEAVGTLVDLELATCLDSTAIVELAWHAGALTVVRDTNSSAIDPSGSLEVLQHQAHALDVLVTSAQVEQLVPLSEGGQMLVDVRREFGAADALRLLGSLDPPVDGPSLTVLVTAYDRPAALRRCLDGLAKQSLSKSAFDVLVIDGGSPVDLTPIAREYQSRMRLTTIRMEENLGLGETRRAGVEAASGDIVFLLDDDDVLTPRALSEHLRLHAERPEEDVVVLGHSVMRPGGHPSALSRHVTSIGQQYSRYVCMRDGDELSWGHFWGGRSSAKRALLMRYPFRGTFMEDADVGLRADRGLKSEGSRLRVVYSRTAAQVVLESFSLQNMRRRDIKVALSSRQADPELTAWMQDPRAWREALSRYAALPPAAVQTLEAQADRHLLDFCSEYSSRALRTQLGRLDVLLMADIAAHRALGLIVATTLEQLIEEGRMPTLALQGADPVAVEAASTSRDGDGLRLVVHVEDEQSAAHFTTALEDELARGDRSLESIGDVELRISQAPLEEMPDADFRLGGGARGSGQHRPQRLFGLGGMEWVTWLRSTERRLSGLR